MGVIELTPTINLAEDYRLMTEQALPELGWEHPEAAGVPALEQIQAALSPEVSHYLIELARRGGNASLRIAPRVGQRGGIGVRNLIGRFDPAAYPDGYVLEAVWGAVPDKAAVHNSGPLKDPWDIAIMLDDVTDPLDPVKPINTIDEPGLAYTYQTVDQQRQSLQTERARAKVLGVELVGASVGHLVVDASARRANNQAQRRGVARLWHYDNVESVGGVVRVPDVDADGSRLRFRGSYVGVVWDDDGARRALRVPVKLEI